MRAPAALLLMLLSGASARAFDGQTALGMPGDGRADSACTLVTRWGPAAEGPPLVAMRIDDGHVRRNDACGPPLFDRYPAAIRCIPTHRAMGRDGGMRFTR